MNRNTAAHRVAKGLDIFRLTGSYQFAGEDRAQPIREDIEYPFKAQEGSSLNRLAKPDYSDNRLHFKTTPSETALTPAYRFDR